MVVGVNQYRDNHELQSWSIFFRSKDSIVFMKKKRSIDR
ncbi:hypothetical protein CN609_18855 [Bacillus wiedmannii]|nr:hypothetical protein CN609_18855 [Bacillus wiedmannii]